MINKSSLKKNYGLEPLPLNFYSDSSIVVAQNLIGKYFYSLKDHTLGKIVEIEAYPGDDPINHGLKNKTKKNYAMFLPPEFTSSIMFIIKTSVSIYLWKKTKYQV